MDDDVHGWRGVSVIFPSHGGGERVKGWGRRFGRSFDEALQGRYDMAGKMMGVLKNVDVDTSIGCNTYLEQDLYWSIIMTCENSPQILARV